jgi:hypothetical protein
MKVLFPVPASKTTAVNTSAISLNQPTASLGSSTAIHFITVNPDGIQYHEIIDTEVNEKRQSGVRTDIRESSTSLSTQESTGELMVLQKQRNSWSPTNCWKFSVR